MVHPFSLLDFEWELGYGLVRSTTIPVVLIIVLGREIPVVLIIVLGRESVVSTGVLGGESVVSTGFSFS